MVQQIDELFMPKIIFEDGTEQTNKTKIPNKLKKMDPLEKLKNKINNFKNMINFYLIKKLISILINNYMFYIALALIGSIIIYCMIELKDWFDDEQ